MTRTPSPVTYYKGGSTLEFNQLESFINVVKHNSFSSAAKELYTTQPTISNNIKKLETELNTTLLDRTSKSITLTDSGKIFYKYALDLLNIRDKAKFTISEHSGQVEGHIEICASSIPEEYVLPYIIKGFQEKYPKVSFSATHKNSKDVIDDILDGKLNFGIVGAKYCTENLEYIDFYEDELILCVPNNDKYPGLNYDYIDIKNLYLEKFIFRKSGSGTRKLIEQRLSERNIKLDDLNIVSYIDSNEMIKKMVELGLGVSFISKMAIKNELDLKLIKALRVKNLNLKRSFYLVHTKNRTLSPLVEAFKNFIIEWK